MNIGTLIKVFSVKKNKKSKFHTDITCPFDTRVVKKRQRIENYTNLKYKIKRIWNCEKVEIVPIVNGVLRTMSKNSTYWMKALDLPMSSHVLQKACLLRTA